LDTMIARRKATSLAANVATHRVSVGVTKAVTAPFASLPSSNLPGAYYSNHRCQYFSTTSGSKNASNNTVFFPWYHSEDMVPRMESEIGMVEASRKRRLGVKVWEGSTRYLMGVPLSEIFFGNDEWREELAENSSWAFCHGMASLLSHLYKSKSNLAL